MTYLRNHIVIVSAIAVVIILGAIFAGGKKGSGAEPVSSTVSSVKEITLGEYAKDPRVISAEGTVEGVEQADIKSQVTAPISSINVSIGQVVSPGQILLTLQNADFSASLSQARAGLLAEEARLADMKAPARPEDLAISEADLNRAKTDLKNLYSNVPNSLSDSYAKADDAVRKQTGPLFSGAEEPFPKITFLTSASQAKNDAEFARASLRDELLKWQAEIASLSENSSPEEIESALENAGARLSEIRSFLDRTMDAINGAVNLSQATLDLYRLYITTGRGNITSAISGVNSLSQAIASGKISVSRAENALALKKAGNTSEAISAEEARVEQARAVLQSAEAAIAKTVIRSPISGRVSSLPARVGELAGMGSSLVSVVNPNGLIVKAYISEGDKARVSEGADAVVEGGRRGKVSRVSPSIDPFSGKVEVRIEILDGGENGGLLIGRNVEVQITGSSVAEKEPLYFLPIQAVKVESGKASLYRVDGKGAVAEVPVVLGEVSGEFVEVKTNLSPATKVISPVYGLKAGEKVQVEISN